jgi:signal transduction histidine kinase
MHIRPKPFLTYFLICLAPLLLLAVFNYWNGITASNAAAGADLQDHLNAFTSGVDNVLHREEDEIMRFSVSPATQQFVEERNNPRNVTPRADLSKETKGNSDNNGSLPAELRASVASLIDSRGHFKSVALFAQNSQPLLFAERNSSDPQNSEPILRLYNFPPDQPKPDKRVWDLQGNILLVQPIETNSAGTTLQYTLPVFAENRATGVAALVAVLDLEPVFSEVAEVLEPRTNRDDGLHSTVIVLDPSGKILYHANEALKHQDVSSAIPAFTPTAGTMLAGKSGTKSFSSPAGQAYLATFAPLPRLNVSVAVLRDRSQFLSGAHLAGIIGLLLALVLGGAAAFMLERYIQKKLRSIERVNEGLTAIAKGELNHRIDIRSSDDARGMADNINVVTERLRAQIAREAESRQFASFVRLSAFLTHDLKNSIEALSLIVGNMERHFDNEQFRADAMKSLTGATDKLKALVARISKPVTTLSGEHKRPLPTDLIPILRRVVAMTAEPLREKHNIEMNLPPTLIALADGDRIENVIENLVLNALEAMSEKSGTLTIAGEQTAEGKVVVSVSDTGVGMSEQFIKDRLFHPFATTKTRGVGLGLYTCREVIQANGGSIEASSIDGTGTTFRVMLPSSSTDRRG